MIFPLAKILGRTATRQAALQKRSRQLLLARKARSLASRLSHGASTGDQARAAELLARLLTATDPGIPLSDNDLLDPGFDD